jgi:DNA-directed RNA polymerase specialized sigma24 family protein
MGDHKYARADESPTATLGSTSQSLLDHLRLGSDEDQRLLITLYWSLVLDVYIAKRVVENLDDRLDITNRVFRTAFRRIESQGFKRQGRGAFRAWLRITTKNKVGDFIRRERRRKAKAKDLAEARNLLRATVEGEGEGGFDENTERALLVRQAIEVVRAEFEPGSFEMARLQLMEGRSAADAGASCGKSANAASVAKSRVKHRLHKILGRFEIWDTRPRTTVDRPGARS